LELNIYEKKNMENNKTRNGCPKCSLSKGERKIMAYLDKMDIEYISEFRINGCKNQITLPFDFYLPKYNMCIEYDGEQHFRPIEYFGGIKTFEKQIERDKIKNDYYLDNNIKLIRIPFNMFDEIENILISELNKSKSSTINKELIL